MGKRKLETLLMIQQVQTASKGFTEQTGCTHNPQIYESAIMKQFQISYGTYLQYMKEKDVSRQIAASKAKST